VYPSGRNTSKWFLTGKESGLACWLKQNIDLLSYWTLAEYLDDFVGHEEP
jgi:hypothetical protein